MSSLFDEQLNYLQNLSHFTPSKVVSGEYELSLNAISELLSLVGNPENQLKIIHVAGTNGKGSTIAFLSHILMAAGLRVGVFTSPALLNVTEQIRIDDELISEDDFAKEVISIKPFIDEMISKGHRPTTEFETVTVMALRYFLEKSCDIVLLECGLGGRTDATNVVSSPVLSVITSIGLDHTEILGSTLEKIASEKSGIIKQNGTAVVLEGPVSVLDVFRNKCLAENAELVIANRNIEAFGNKPLGLNGKYQQINASLAVACAHKLRDKGFSISDEAIFEGLAKASWPCRFEVFDSKPVFVIDGGHNIDGITALRDSLLEKWPGRKFRFVVGVLGDKAYKSMMELVIPIASSFYTVTVPSPRALPADELSTYLNSVGAFSKSFASVEEVVNAAIADSSSDDIICAFGSLYYVGLVRDIIISSVSK